MEGRPVAPSSEAPLVSHCTFQTATKKNTPLHRRPNTQATRQLRHWHDANVTASYLAIQNSTTLTISITWLVSLIGLSVLRWETPSILRREAPTWLVCVMCDRFDREVAESGRGGGFLFVGFERGHRRPDPAEGITPGSLDRWLFSGSLGRKPEKQRRRASIHPCDRHGAALGRLCLCL